MPFLRIAYIETGKTGRTALIGPEAVVGRDASCDVTLDDVSTSRRHARFCRDGKGGYRIEDLRSKNGTLLNDVPVTIAAVGDGDRITIGGCVLTFVAEDRPSVVLSDAVQDAPGATSAWGSQQQLDLPRKRLEKLYELNARLTGRFDRDDLLGEVLDICVELLRFERAGIAVWLGPPHPPQWIKLRNLRDAAHGEFRISRTLVDRALHRAERVLINDTTDVEIDPTASMISNNIRSAMCVPMEYLQEVRGVIYGDRVTSTGGYTKEDIDFFAALGRLGAMGLANVQLVDELRRRQQVELQLQLARQIQSQLLPAEPLIVGGLTVDALNDPGQKVSGDYYDYFVRPDGLVGLIVADVAGKGIPASLLMANLQAGVHLILKGDGDLVVGVEALNRLICQNVADAKFITAIFGLLDPRSRTFTYINAGHPAPYVVDGTGAVKLQTEPGLPLGIEDDFHYTAEVARLPESAATLFVYSDGVPEAENEQGKQYGEGRLAEALADGITHAPGELINRIRRSVKQYTRSQPQGDDITILAARLE
jgi:sigma-B regulation protein RsbU (phosphoserine phosphatase)